MDKKTIRIPPFLVKTLNELPTKEEKNIFVENLQRWYASEYTETLHKFLREELERSLADEDKRNSFTSFFDFKFQSAHERGRRRALRDMIKQLGEFNDQTI
jgi:hypothetical protein